MTDLLLGLVSVFVTGWWFYRIGWSDGRGQGIADATSMLGAVNKMMEEKP